MDASILKKLYKQGKRDFANIDLHGADLAGVVLVGANLEGATLFGANLEGADLRDVNFTAANLQQANLSGANLIGANLTEANLRRANLMDALLDKDKTTCDGAIFTGTMLPNGQLYSASADLLASMEGETLSAEEIQRDLQKHIKPQPQVGTPPKPRQPRHNSQEFIQDIPKLPLALFFTSYVGFGGLMAASPGAVHPLFWLALIGASSLWRVSFDYVWIIPAINAFIILFSYNIPPMLLIFMGLTFGMVLLNSKFNRSLSSGVALRESLWIVSIAFSALVSLLAGQMILIGAIICGTVGMSLPLHMDTELFPYQQILFLTNICAGCGLIMGLLFRLIFFASA